MRHLLGQTNATLRTATVVLSLWFVVALALSLAGVASWSLRASFGQAARSTVAALPADGRMVN
jgi:hypothetical protein